MAAYLDHLPSDTRGLFTKHMHKQTRKSCSPDSEPPLKTLQTSASLQSSAINFASKDNNQLQAQDDSNQKCVYKQVLENLYDRMLFR